MGFREKDEKSKTTELSGDVWLRPSWLYLDLAMGILAYLELLGRKS